jgi:hypothetical protein
MGRHLLRKKVCQSISVMKTNTAVIVVFKTKRELKCQFSGNMSAFVFITEILWRTFWRNKWRSVFDVVKDCSLCLCTQYGRRKPPHKNMIFLTICLLVIVMGAWWWCLNSKKKCGSFPTINNISTFAKGRKAAFSFWGHHGSSILMTHLPGNLLGKKSSNYHIINHLAKVLIYCKVTNHNQ